jgi:hypothetical protein
MLVTIFLVEVNKPPGVLRCIMRHCACSFCAVSIPCSIYSAVEGLMPSFTVIETTFWPFESKGNNIQKAMQAVIQCLIALFLLLFSFARLILVIYAKRR